MHPPTTRRLTAVRLVFVGVGAMLCLLLATACDPDAEPRTTLRFWHGFTGKDGEVMLELVRRFNRENPDIEVTLQHLTWDTYYNKLFVTGLADGAPEVFVAALRKLQRDTDGDCRIDQWGFAVRRRFLQHPRLVDAVVRPPHPQRDAQARLRFHRAFIPTSHSAHIGRAHWERQPTPDHPMLFRLLATSLLLVTIARACLNTPGTALNGRASGSHYAHDANRLRHSIRMSGPNPNDLRFDKPAASAAKQLEREALVFIYSGDYAAARPLLEKAEAAAPDDYSVAANLGTVCELLGDNTAALKWIAEAMRRNPDSHRGTEWVHLLILKAKLLDANHPASTQPTPLLTVPERLGADTPLTIDGVSRPAAQVREAILYQLQERLVFVKPRDRYVAELLFALARLNANLVNIESAAGVLTLAQDYGYANGAHIDALQDDIDGARRKATFLTTAYWILGLGIFTGLLVCAYRRKWFFLSRAACEAHRAAVRNQREPKPAASCETAKRAAPSLEPCDR